MRVRKRFHGRYLEVDGILYGICWRARGKIRSRALLRARNNYLLWLGDYWLREFVRGT